MDPIEKLVEEARRGSREAFSQILRLYQGRVRIFIRRFVMDRDAAEDLSQETFLAAYRDLKSLSPETSFELWLLAIARNRALRYLRDLSRQRAHESSSSLEAALAGWCAQAAAQEDPRLSQQERDVAALKTCLEKLPEPSATLVHAFYFDRRNAAEIARQSGRNPVAVRVTLLRIREALGRCIRLRLAGQEAPV